MPHRKSPAALLFPLLALLAAPALAVHPGTWTHNSEADFSAGTTDSTVVTNLGQVKLSAHTHTLADLAAKGSVVTALQAAPNGDLYIAIGPDTHLLRRASAGVSGGNSVSAAGGNSGGKIDDLADLDNEQIFALAWSADGHLLAGISGPTASRLAVLTNDNHLTTIAQLPGVRYIWDMLVDGPRVILATGTDGDLIQVDLAAAAKEIKSQVSLQKSPPSQPNSGLSDQKSTPATKPSLPTYATILMHAKQDNFLCLGRDGQGRIYVGTDTDGLVYRVTPKLGSPPDAFVILDAQEPEIGALLVMGDGTVYAGTADAEQAHPGGRLKPPAESDTGRPAKEKSIAPPITPPKPPALPPKPTPTPGPTPGNAAAPPAGAPVSPAGKAATPNAPAAPAAKANTPDESPADRLRAAILKDLAAHQTGAGAIHRNSGPPGAPTPPHVPPMPMHPPMPNMPPGMAAPTQPGTKAGNAIYRIDPQGFSTEYFRENAMILRIIEDPSHPGRLLVATGNSGQLFAVDPAAEETTILTDLKSQQIPALAAMANGDVILGAANPAAFLQLDKGYAASGNYTSTVLDASQISLWGKLRVVADLPANTGLTVQTRSGNVDDPDDAPWSDWSKPATVTRLAGASPATPIEMPISSPPARFLQYRLSFTTSPSKPGASTGGGDNTAAVDRVSIAYITPNLKPVISSIQASYTDAQAGAPGPRLPKGMSRAHFPPAAGGNAASDNPAEPPQPNTTMKITWDASDPNDDHLKYTLEYQASGTDKWLPLADDLDTNSFDWPTTRVPDGRYLIRVTASDAPDNPPDMAKTASRISDPVVVDNTPPEIKEVKVDVQSGGVTIKATVADNLTPIQDVKYAVDQTKNWQPVLPDDLIYDSTSEAITIKISPLTPGPHVVTLRALDGQNNARYQAIQVDAK